MTEDPELTVGLLAAKFDDAWPDSAPEWVAEQAVRTLNAAARKALLRAMLTDRIVVRRRAHVRRVEQASYGGSWPSNVHELLQRDHDQEASAFMAAHAERCDIPHGDSRAAIDAAHACDNRLQAGEPPRPRRTEVVRMEEQERERLRSADPEEYRRRFPSPWDQVAQAIADFRDEVRLELTTELLGATFAVGAGHRVTWGRASIADHEQRMALLANGIEGSARTMVLHEKAVELLTERGASCLNDVRFAA